MATVLSDDFNAYNDGDLNGQGSWSGDAEFDIQGVTVREGAKAVQVGNVTGKSVTKVGTERADGKQSFYLRKSSSTGKTIVYIYNDGQTQLLLSFYYGVGNIGWIYGAGFAIIAAVDPNLWHLIETEWRSSDHKYRVRVNGGSWTNWENYNGNFESNPKEVVLLADDPIGVGENGYWDFFNEEPVGVSIEAPLMILATSPKVPTLSLVLSITSPLMTLLNTIFSPIITLVGWIPRNKPSSGGFTKRTKPDSGGFTARTKPDSGGWTKRTKP